MNLTRENLLKIYRVLTALDALQGNNENFAYAELIDEALDILAQAIIEEGKKKRKGINGSYPIPNPFNFSFKVCPKCYTVQKIDKEGNQNVKTAAQY